MSLQDLANCSCHRTHAAPIPHGRTSFRLLQAQARSSATKTACARFILNAGRRGGEPWSRSSAAMTRRIHSVQFRWSKVGTLFPAGAKTEALIFHWPQPSLRPCCTKPVVTTLGKRASFPLAMCHPVSNGAPQFLYSLSSRRSGQWPLGRWLNNLSHLKYTSPHRTPIQSSHKRKYQEWSKRRSSWPPPRRALQW